jgi:hypothetical protein
MMKMLSLMKSRILDHKLCICEYGLRLSWQEESSEAVFTDAKFMIYDPEFHQRRHFHRDFYLVLINNPGEQIRVLIGPVSINSANMMKKIFSRERNQ